MIKTNELRIGNLIFDDDGSIAKVIGLKPYEHSVRCDEEEGCDILIDIHGADGKVRRGYAIESPECNPIPLTPEWLQRCGFKFAPSIGYYVYELLNKPQGIDNIKVGSGVYLHHLQNLYFALTGEELNVKL